MSISAKLTTIAENVPKVHAAGKKVEYDAFWDKYQDYGKKFKYFYAFAGTGWTDETFKPKYNLIFSYSNINAFAYCRVTDLVQKLSECGITIDTTQCNSFTSMFAYAETSTVPAMDTTSATGINQMFYEAKKLVTIEKLKVKEETTYNAAFNNCESLENITFEGIIGQNINLSACLKLSYDSLMNIISCLKDYSGTTTTKTLSLHADSKAKLTDAEKALITQKGWTLA